MHALKARVHQGRYVIDEPTDLPEGVEVALVMIEDDDLSAEQRAKLHASLEQALNDEDAGRFVDTAQFLAEINADT
jgi:hypothetical protein